MRSQLAKKDSDAGKDLRQKEKKGIEDEMVGWHPSSVHKFEQPLGDDEGQGSLMCFSSCTYKEQTPLSFHTANVY